MLSNQSSASPWVDLSNSKGIVPPQFARLGLRSRASCKHDTSCVPFELPVEHVQTG